MKIAVFVAFMLALLGVAIYVAVSMWDQIGPSDMGVHGTLALILMVVFGLVVGIGLMGLIFYSHRKGYDR